MPTLEWIGKSKVINHHQKVPFRVLERKYSFDENGQHSFGCWSASTALMKTDSTAKITAVKT